MPGVNINARYLEALKEEVQEEGNANIVSEALELYRWAAKQKKLGKSIFSANDQGEEIEEITIPALEKLRNHL